MKKDEYRKTRLLYIIEAAIEYFISLMTTGTYVALLASHLGMSDDLTGIMTSLTSLGCVFQLFSLFLSKKSSVKRAVVLLHSINQAAFALMYFVPFVDLPEQFKITFFIILLLAAHALHNGVQPAKINWYMSLVEDKRRGSFTANKEIVSLVSGACFSFGMGAIVDYLKESGRVELSFTLCGITLFSLTVLHSLTLLLSREMPAERGDGIKVLKTAKKLLSDKGFAKILVLSGLWNIAFYGVTPFYASYTIKELGFSLIFISVQNAISAICRVACSRPLGRYADRTSFSRMLNVCYLAALAAFAVNIFTVPSNARLLFTVYSVLFAVAMAGINSAEVNLVYDCVKGDEVASALAIKNALVGVVGFISTVAASRLVRLIQEDGNRFLGIEVYAQQVASFLGAIILLIIIIYLNTVVKKSARRTR